MDNKVKNKIFDLQKEGFQDFALGIFHFQYFNNPLYKSYVDTLGLDPTKFDRLSKIPFLPIHFFKSHKVMTTPFEPEAVFESSGTTQTLNSKHFVRELELYRKSFRKGFELFYGEIRDFCIIGLLPSYLERNNSSLIAMVDDLINASLHPQSGFYLYEHEKLYEVLLDLEKKGKKTLLIGVSFALLDFAEKFQMKLKHTILMETGGMKGRRKELTRMETHDYLKERLGVEFVHSEYGMTELLSQGYSKGNGLFQSVPWMRVLVRKEDDPFEVNEEGNGIINVVDLANIYSCSFIATDDVGSIHKDGSFEISGRVDNSDIRGCSLLVV